VKILVEIKEHKVAFVLGLLANMPFVKVTVVEEEKQ
jgi:hypothetical protein